MLQTAVKDALKEWAVTIRALGQGKLVFLMRKGGIREKEFTVEHEEFLLYPTYEHQRADLLQPAYQEDLKAVLEPWGGQAPKEADRRHVTFTHFAQVAEVIETMDPTRVAPLCAHSIWVPDYAEKRLYWRPRKPLEVILVRVFRLEDPVTIPTEPYFYGCRSWVGLPSGMPLGALKPVLDEAQWQEKAGAVREVLA